MILADAATANTDGTFSLLRGGISQVQIARNAPAFFKASVIARIWGDRSEAGRHIIELSCVDRANSPIIPIQKGEVEIGPEGGSIHIVSDIQMVFPRMETFTFQLTVDGTKLSDWPIEVMEAKIK